MCIQVAHHADEVRRHSFGQDAFELRVVDRGEGTLEIEVSQPAWDLVPGSVLEAELVEPAIELMGGEGGCACPRHPTILYI